MTKECKKCLMRKDLNEFYTDYKGLFGRQSYCKECKSLKDKEYREKNIDKAKAYDKMRYERDKEKRVQLMKNYAEKNKEKLVAYNKNYREKNKEQLSQKNKEYYKQNKETIIKQVSTYKKQNRPKYNLLNMKRKKIIKDLPFTLTHDQWIDTLDYFGNSCAVCKSTDNLHIDHWYPVSKYKVGTVKYNCIPLCSVCNMEKHNKHPHIWLKDQLNNLIGIQSYLSSQSDYYENLPTM